MHNLMENNINDTKLLVSALENGTVLDHIPAEVVYKAPSRLPTNFSKMSS